MLRLQLHSTAPASNGGSAITGYTVISNPGNITGSGAASPITVTGLTNGTFLYLYRILQQMPLVTVQQVLLLIQ
jgi:hypothetical protein